MRRRAALVLVALTAGRTAHADEPLPSSPAPPPPSLAPTETEAPKPADDDRLVVIWPTLTPAGDDVGAGAIHRPLPGEGAIRGKALELDATLRDAVEDLGFTLEVADAGPVPGHARDLDMVERAQHSRRRAAKEDDPGSWVISPRLEPLSSDTYLLRIVVVAPKSKQLRVRVEQVSEADVSVRGLVLLRDLLAEAKGAPALSGPRPQESAALGIMSPLRSPGRAVLAANAALFGAFMAFSVQRASGSSDPRLLYPLLTLGAGIGLGTALLVCEEWNVSTGDAWTLAGGAWWGAASGILIANGRKDIPLTDRYTWGVGGGLIGLSLATFSLTRWKADEGDALLLHSAAAMGLGLGALGDFYYRGSLDQTPYTGAGYGAAIGLVAGGAIGRFTVVSPSRVMLIDLGAGLGAAAGAAAGSPLVFENVTEAKTRGFVAATFGGTVVGAATAWWLTRDHHDDKPHADAPRVVPFGGAIGQSLTRSGAVPAYGLGARGSF